MASATRDKHFASCLIVSFKFKIKRFKISERLYGAVPSHLHGNQCASTADVNPDISVVCALVIVLSAVVFVSVMDFDCLATWKNNRRNFVAGRVTSQGAPDDKNSIYRCIVSITSTFSKHAHHQWCTL